jgi:hypothetical protein
MDKSTILITNLITNNNNNNSISLTKTLTFPLKPIIINYYNSTSLNKNNLLKLTTIFT